MATTTRLPARPTSGSPRPSPLAVVLVVVAVLATACGGGSNTVDTAASTAPRSTSTSTTSTTSSSTSTSTSTTTSTTTSVAEPASTTSPPPPWTPPPASSAAPTAPPTTPAPAGRIIDQISHTGGASKIITVRATNEWSTVAELMAWEHRDGAWVLVYGPWRADTGGGGWAWQPGEGTRRSPIGNFSFGTGFGTKANPGYRYGWIDVTTRDYWVLDPASSEYNTHQVADAPRWARYEKLDAYGASYFYSVLINFNVPAVAGVGSAIFLHVTKGGSTAGCIAIREDHMAQILRWIDPNTRIIMGPEALLPTLQPS